MSPPDDPLVEAGRWLNAKLAGASVPNLLLVIGLGEGHLLDVLATRAPDTKVLALEPDPEATRAFRARRDWTDWLNSGRLVYLVAPDYEGADEAWRIFPPTEAAHTLLSHPSIEASPSPAAVQAARVLKKILFGARANAAARRRFAPPYLLNSIRNLPAIASGSDVRALTDAFRGVPAVIVGAGPSLDGSVAELRAAAGRALVISTDTALRPLLEAGLTPPLAVGVDPGAANARHFKWLPDTAGTWLVCESALDPVAAGAFSGRTFWFRVAPHHPWPWYNELGIDVGRIEVWASVLTAAFNVAVLGGCDPIVFVGADLAFTDGRPYCRGTTFEFEWALSAANGRELQWAWDEKMGREDRLERPDVRGGQTTTTHTLVEVRDWLVRQASRCGRRVINATGGGILLGGAIQQSSSLLEAISRAPQTPPVSPLPRAPTVTTPRPALARKVREAQSALAGESAPPPAVKAWAEFCGDGYDPAAIAAALGEAGRALETVEQEPRPDSRPASVLARSIASTRISQVVARLPEAVARLRAAAKGDIGLPPPPLASRGEPIDAERLLVAAFDLLCRLYPAAVEEDDLPAPLAGHWVGGPVSSHVAWSDDVARAAQAFEGLLGNAWTQPLPPEVSTFYLPPVPPRTHPPGSDAPPGESAGRPNTTEACALLAIEWLLCAANEARWSVDELVRLVSVLHWVAAAFQFTGGAHEQEGGARVEIRVEAGKRSANLELPLPEGARMLAHLAPTGTGTTTDNRSWELARIETVGGLVATVDVQTVALPVHPGDDRDTSRPVRIWIPPHVLGEGFVARAMVSYAGPHGAVIAPMVGAHQGPNTVVMREDGSVEPHHAWPRPVLLELPLGDDGAVAWGQGAPEYVNGCVMYRHGRAEPVAIEELPFIPGAGSTWWRGRLYWACWPAGVGSWAPGEEVEFSLPQLSLCGIRGDDSGLRLDPWILVDGVLAASCADPWMEMASRSRAGTCRARSIRRRVMSLRCRRVDGRRASRRRRRHARISRRADACVVVRLPVQGGVGGAIAAG